MEQSMSYIYQIYQDKSFSKAAEHLYMTQPALSLAVKKVESALGTEIFDRSCHPLELTDVGKTYIETICSIKSLEEDMAKKVEDLRSLNTGTLRLGGTHYLNNYIWAPVLGEFTRKYPGIKIELMEDSSPNLAIALKNNQLDIIPSCDPEIITQFEHYPAFRDYILLAIHNGASLPAAVETAKLSDADILAKKHMSLLCESVPLSSFQEQEFILLGEGNNLNDRCRQMFAASQMTPNVKMSIAQMVTAFRLADNGLGATFISDRLIRSATSNLSFFRIDSPLADRQFYFLLPKRNYTPFAVKAFMNFAEYYIVR